MIDGTVNGIMKWLIAQTREDLAESRELLAEMRGVLHTYLERNPKRREYAESCGLLSYGNGKPETTTAAIHAHMNEHAKYLQASEEDRVDAEIRRELKVVQENHRLMGIKKLTIKRQPVEEVLKAYEDAMIHGEGFIKTSWDTCQHVACDNGMRRSWCKTCDTEMVLDHSGLWVDA